MKNKNSRTKEGQFLAAKHDVHLSEDAIFPYEPASLKRPKKSDWYVSFYVWSQKQGKVLRRKRVVTGTTKKEQRESAAKLIEEINFLLKNGAHIDPVNQLRNNGGVPLVVAMDEYMQEKRSTLKEQSVTTYEKWCRYFISFLTHADLVHINIEDFNNEHASDLRKHALNTLKMGNKAYNTYKGFVSGFFIYSKPIYKLPGNPIADTLHNLPTKTSKHLAYNETQIAEYKDACDELELPELWFFVRMIYYTFCRPHEELRKMQVGDIKDDHIMIYAETSKTNHRTVMIPPGLEKIFIEWSIRSYPPHFYVFSHGYKPGPTMISRLFMYEKHRKVTAKMSIDKKGYDIYGWKHTGVIALYKVTKDLMLVKEQCGHTDVRQTVEYLRDLGVLHYSSGIDKFPEI